MLRASGGHYEAQHEAFTALAAGAEGGGEGPRASSSFFGPRGRDGAEKCGELRLTHLWPRWLPVPELQLMSSKVSVTDFLCPS